MDINILGIGGIIGALLLSTLNLYIFLSNRKKDEIKERIEKLYSPLYVHYREHTYYGSKELFEELLYKESEFRDLTEDGRAKKMMKSLFRNDKGLEVDLKNMIVRIGGWIEREHDELQIYYAKGFFARWSWRLFDSNKRGLVPAGRSFE